MSFYKSPKDEWTHQQTRLRCKHTAEWRRHVAEQEGVRNTLLIRQEQERQQCMGDLLLLRDQQNQALARLQQYNNQTRQALRTRQAAEMAELRQRIKAARRGRDLA
jgi:hypothetical protein